MAARSSGNAIYLRLADLIGQPEVTPEQAEENRRRQRRPVRARAGRVGLLPFSGATVWRLVRQGEFPAPVKLTDRVRAWEKQSVERWLASRKK